MLGVSWLVRVVAFPHDLVTYICIFRCEDSSIRRLIMVLREFHASTAYLPFQNHDIRFTRCYRISDLYISDLTVHVIPSVKIPILGLVFLQQVYMSSCPVSTWSSFAHLQQLNKGNIINSRFFVLTITISGNQLRVLCYI